MAISPVGSASVEPQVSEATDAGFWPAPQKSNEPDRTYWDYFVDPKIPWHERAIAGMALPIASVLSLAGCLPRAHTKTDTAPDLLSDVACMVYDESDFIGIYKNTRNLRYMVELYTNGGSRAVCTVPSGWTDEGMYDQAIYFMTGDNLGWDENLHKKDDANRVDDSIVLQAPLTLNNKSKTLVIGNIPHNTTPPAGYNYGTVHLDAWTNGLEKVFTCGSRQDDGSVTLRNLIIQTMEITYDELFANSPCLVDGGNVTVDVGTSFTVEDDL